MNNSFAIARSGEVYAWGSSAFGKFGVPKSSDWKTELPYKLYMKGTQNVHQIVPGPFHTMFLSKDGEMYVFGASNDGKLGVFRLDERMVALGKGNETGHYIIDWPWKLFEGVPSRFYKSHDH